MPADDSPSDALKHRFEMEDVFVSPVAKKVLSLASFIKFGWPVDKAIEKIRAQMGADSVERISLLLETVAEQLRKHDEDIRLLQDGMTEEDCQARTDIFRDLLLDGARKSEATRAKERVKRIGLILANGTVEPIQPNPDDIEEMMRVAMELSDRDVEYLRELIKIQGPSLVDKTHILREQAHWVWDKGFWGNRVDTEIDSVFSKLESYGLVARLAPPNNLNMSADFQNRYVLLRKGARFAELINDTAAKLL